MLASQLPPSGKGPDLLTLNSQEEKPSYLAESPGQVPGPGQRSWGFCNVAGSLPTIWLVLTVHRTFHFSDLICPSQHLYACWNNSIWQMSSRNSDKGSCCK